MGRDFLAVGLEFFYNCTKPAFGISNVDRVVPPP